MDDKEAKALLIKLQRHYGEPVMPVSKYCNALRTWGKCITEAYEEDTKDTSEESANNWPSRYQYPRFKDIVNVIGSLELAISKSSLLYRLIYGEEKLRTKKCPKHEGIWSGLPSPNNDCEHGCGLTGWIPDDFVPPKPGDPCRHNWTGTGIEGDVFTTRCYHCNELIKKSPHPDHVPSLEGAEEVEEQCVRCEITGINKIELDSSLVKDDFKYLCSCNICEYKWYSKE